jgi:TRAP transporter TAXI family solute receptor
MVRGLTVMLIAGLAVAAGGAAAQDKKQFSIGTGTTGAVFYPLGGAMANILTKKVPGWAVTAEATAGSVANMHMLRDGKAELVLTQLDTAYDALKGLDKFTGKPVPHKVLAIIYANKFHVVTMEGTGINALADLKGKRISTAPPVSASEVLALRVLEAIGMSFSDIKRERLAPAESTNAMKDGKLDGYFFAGGPPVAAITDLAASQGIKIKLIDHDFTVPKIVAKYGPLYTQSTVPAKSYPGQDTDSKVLAIWNAIVVGDQMADDTANTIVKTIWESRDDLVATHKAALEMTPEIQKLSYTPTPYHPAALRYFAEKGIKIE